MKLFSKGKLIRRDDLLLAAAAVFLLLGCSKSTGSGNDMPDGPTVVDQVKASVTTTGADLKLKNGMTLSVPAGAVTGPTNVTLSQLSGDTSFSASFQTILKLDFQGTLGSGFLKIPLDSNQRVDRVAAAYRPVGETGALPLEGTADATGDTFVVNMALSPSSMQAAGASGDVGTGTYVVERDAGYVATRSEAIIPIPYYAQDGENCWAAALLMYLRSYRTVLSLGEIYQLLYLFGLDRDAGLDYSSAGQISKNTELLTNLKTEQNTWISYENFVDYCIKSIEDGKPVLTCVISHQIVICGFEKVGTGTDETTYLIFHDPQNHLERTAYTRWTKAQVRAQWWNQGIVGFTIWNFVTVAMTTPLPQAARLQTIHLPYPDTMSADIRTFGKGMGFAHDNRVVGTARWDHRQASGLLVGNNGEVPRNITRIVLKSVPVWNADRSNAASVRIKTSLYRVQNGSFKIPALQETEETRSIPPISEYAYSTAFQVEDFIADLAGGDTLFAVETEIFDPTSLRLDDFNVRFKYRPLRINSLNPESGQIGDNVSIYGIGFGHTAGTVTFDGISAEVQSWKDTVIVTKVPVGAESGDVMVAIGPDSSNAVSFSIGDIMALLRTTKYCDVTIFGAFTTTEQNTMFGLYFPGNNWVHELDWAGTECSKSYQNYGPEDFKEAESVTATFSADGQAITHLVCSYTEDYRPGGRLYTRTITELEATDIPLNSHSVGDYGFQAYFDIPLADLATKVVRLTWSRTYYNSEGNQTGEAHVTTVDWNRIDHEGEVSISFFERSPL
jgi:hypothetical protein